VDGFLNTSISDLTVLRLDCADSIQLVDADAGKLPAAWWGDLVFTSPALDENRILLVPYCEAGQMSSEKPIRTWIRQRDDFVDVDNTELKYTGSGWKVENEEHGHYRGSVHVTDREGDCMEFQFTGTAVELYGCAYEKLYGNTYKANKMDVYLDGQHQGEFYFFELHHQRRMFRFDGLEKKKHILKVVCKDEHTFIDYLRYRP
jgi:hypothetical protein